MEAIVVLVNLPDLATAEKLARRLVESGLAACVNIFPMMTSIYRWQGNVEQTNEVTALVKTTRTRYEELEAAVTELHPYDVPEIIALPIVAGLPAYLHWLAQETNRNANG